MASCFLAGSAVRGLMPAPDCIDNSLHCCMTVRVDEVGIPLLAKALAMTCAETSFVLVALDLCFLLRAHCDRIRQAIADSISIHPERIVVSCSHTHSAPFVEPLDAPHPYFDFISRQCVEAATEAWDARSPARFGHGVTHVVGASFNTRAPTADGGVRFARDFREGLATGRPVDPRLNMVRIDAESGAPIAG